MKKSHDVCKKLILNLPNILATDAQADAVKNFNASNLIGLNSADKTKLAFLNGLVQAHDAHNEPLPESVRKDPKLVQDSVLQDATKWC